MGGPGAPLNDCVGASHGGRGGGGGPEVYGSAAEPVDFGSGSGSAGGGAIRLVVTDTLTVNGAITADGADWHRGTGSGGSVYITAKHLTGAGRITASGGDNGCLWGCNGGGGGRIAVYYETSDFPEVNAVAGGGGGCGLGEEGTVGFYDVPLDELRIATSWRFQESDSPFNFSRVVLTGSRVTVEENVVLNAGSLAVEGASVELRDNAVLTIPLISLTNSTLTVTGKETVNAPDGIPWSRKSLFEKTLLDSIAAGVSSARYRLELYVGEGNAIWVVIGVVVLLVLTRVKRNR